MSINMKFNIGEIVYILPVHNRYPSAFMKVVGIEEGNWVYPTRQAVKTIIYKFETGSPHEFLKYRYAPEDYLRKSPFKSERERKKFLKKLKKIDHEREKAIRKIAEEFDNKKEKLKEDIGLCQ